MEYDPITVAETGVFQRKAGRLLSENDKAELLTYLAMHPNAGVIIQGTGGIRKLRWAREGMGKSGGVRVIDYFHNLGMPLYLLTIFGKGEKSDLRQDEKNALAKAVKKLVNYWSHE